MTIEQFLNMRRASSPNYSHNQGFLLANYLAGTNASRQAGATGPLFLAPPRRDLPANTRRGSLTASWPKFSALVPRPFRPTYPYVSGNVGEQIGHRFMVAPYVFPGWLSRQWVIGVGRSPKVTQMYMEIGAFPSDLQGNLGPCKSFNLYPAFADHGYLARVVAAGRLFRREKVLPLQGSRFFIGHREPEVSFERY